MGDAMAHTWYVTYEVPSRGILPRRRNPRLTKGFVSEAEARNFAREKFDEGLIVSAGTLNPSSPKRIIPPTAIAQWLTGTAAPDGEHPEDTSSK
jgi:hypothetical protein